MSDLYEREVSGPFAALCGGGTANDGNMESCITLAELHGGGYALGETLRLTAGNDVVYGYYSKSQQYVSRSLIACPRADGQPCPY
ncbi:hypothetical protein Q5762_18560 [Streptomyces sp. P9(2023)]|uniref:hypothetical protein n=1 Tax=Streptomyces sp. P9(2023) TaxID=3064394 RepID=UPI0028F42F03|nr:hypothetical protein [Streptomyces sp. P9(2023)]MDT9690306.1 hypothetical protein [Streptomyces sp. P9(2023)]